MFELSFIAADSESVSIPRPAREKPHSAKGATLKAGIYLLFGSDGFENLDLWNMEE